MKRKNKRSTKAVISVVAALSCVAVAGIGYSAWVVSASIDSADDNVVVIAENVIDNSASLKAEASGSYYFAPTGTVTSGYIYDDLQGQKEALTATISLEITIPSTSTADYTFSIALDGGEYLASAINATYIVGPWSGCENSATAVAIVTAKYAAEGYTIAAAENTYVSSTSSLDGAQGMAVIVGSSTDNGTSTTYAVEIQVNFGWGAFFNYKNPDTAGANGILLDQTSTPDAYQSLSNISTALQQLYAWFDNDPDAQDATTFTYTISGVIDE